MFGASFFGWDQGNVFRVNDLFRLLGTPTLQPFQLSDLPSTAERAASMPSWPTTGSVDWIDDILVVKLSPMTPYQQHSLCQVHPGSTLCATIHSSKWTTP